MRGGRDPGPTAGALLDVLLMKVLGLAAVPAIVRVLLLREGWKCSPEHLCTTRSEVEDWYRTIDCDGPCLESLSERSTFAPRPV